MRFTRRFARICHTNLWLITITDFANGFEQKHHTNKKKTRHSTQCVRLSSFSVINWEHYAGVAFCAALIFICTSSIIFPSSLRLCLRTSIKIIFFSFFYLLTSGNDSMCNLLDGHELGCIYVVCKPVLSFDDAKLKTMYMYVQQVIRVFVVHSSNRAEFIMDCVVDRWKSY